jgi:C-terminal processing protease CtpA/Prc
LNPQPSTLLIQTGPDSVGVGIFFKPGQEGSLLVSSIVPGSSAHLSGLIMVGDRIAGVDNEVIVGKSQKALREKIHGKPGTFVALDIERKVRRPL